MFLHVNRPTDLPVTCTRVCICIYIYKPRIYMSPRVSRPCRDWLCTSPGPLHHCLSPSPPSFALLGWGRPGAALTRPYSAPGAPRLQARRPGPAAGTATGRGQRRHLAVPGRDCSTQRAPRAGRPTSGPAACGCHGNGVGGASPGPGSSAGLREAIGKQNKNK